MRLLREQDRLLEARLSELRAEVAVGLDQANRGELIPMEEVRTKLKARKKAKRE
ncbi:MAG: hypothetical protein PVJ76_21680 [Gemmatimonadota bacterium]